MMHELPFKPFALLVLALVSAPISAHGQEGSGEEEAGAEYSPEPFGKLAGNPVFYKVKSEHSYGTRHSEGWSYECSIVLRTITKEENGPDTSDWTLLSWAEEYAGEGGEDYDRGPSLDSCKAAKNSLTLFSGGSVLAELTYRKRELVLAPEFRKKILDGLEKNAPIATGKLQTVLSGLEDPQIHEVLQAYAIGDSAEQGYVDDALAAVADFLLQAKDKNARKYCRRLADSLTAWKKSKQPVFLAEARKAGKLLNAPVYPPLDSPTVFWKDSVLCVVQEDTAKPASMRTFDPRTGKWGPKAKLKYPESGMYQMYEKQTGTWSMMCNYETFCWSKNMGPITDDPCDGISCGPLIILDDSAGGSIQSPEDLAKAGGSCAAGGGSLEFIEGGKVRIMDSAKVAWTVLPGDVRYGSRRYDFPLSREYPVVVSPNQDWIAYAVDSKDGKSIELWVARLKYKR